MDTKRELPRQKSLILPEVVNPFVSWPQLTWYDKIRIAVMSLTVAPLRLVLLALTLLIAWPLAGIAVAGRTEEDWKKPMAGWRKWFKGVLCFLGRGCFFLIGFHWVEINGKLASAEEVAMLVVGPHQSFFDTLILFVCGLPSAISRIENIRLPLLGTLAQFTQPILVHREDPNSRQNTIKEIKRRAQSGGQWPQIVIFPEGTCTNGTCLISFKPGAFYPAVPVQPVCIRYTNRLDTYTWAWEGPGAFTLLWLTLCQFHNGFEVEYLPVYNPSEEEVKDAKLYARNVRATMARALNIPFTDHTFEDCRLMKYANELNLPMAAGIVEFHKLNQKLGLKLDNIKDLMERFGAIDMSNRGHISLQDFAKYLKLPVSEPLKQTFQMYDRDGSGTIDFREYVIGLSLISQPANSEDTIKLAFQLFDHENKGYISQSDLCLILENAFGMDEDDVKELFTNVDSDKDGKITYDEFRRYAHEKPEYAKLFMTYRELTGSDPNSPNTTNNGDDEMNGNGYEQEVESKDATSKKDD